jgi:hypothetical protein
MGDRRQSVDEIGVHPGIVKDTIYKWISGYAVRAHENDHLWKFKKNEVDDWVHKVRAMQLSGEQ